MTKASTNALLQAAAKTLAWELYSQAAYCRTRATLSCLSWKWGKRSSVKALSRFATESLSCVAHLTTSP
jgi:hypothetical protein